jgi:hypothetical protein
MPCLGIIFNIDFVRLFSTKGVNSIIFSGERIIMAQCRARSTAEESRLDGDRPGEDTLLANQAFSSFL